MADKTPADLIFEGILARATALQLQTPEPPQEWLDAWTPENGCAEGLQHARHYWNQERAQEVERREWEKRPTAGSQEYNPADPLYNMPWKSVVLAAEAMGVSRQAIYKWQKFPVDMPLSARRLLVFFLLAPQWLRDAVIKNTTPPTN